MQVFMLYRKSCPYSIKAIAECHKRFDQQDLLLVEVSEKQLDFETFLAQNKIEQRTVPVVFVDEKFIGGCDELMDFFEREDL